MKGFIYFCSNSLLRGVQINERPGYLCNLAFRNVVQYKIVFLCCYREWFILASGNSEAGPRCVIIQQPGWSQPGYNEQEHKLILARGKLSLMGKMNQVHYILIEHLPCCENNVQDPGSGSIYSFIVNDSILHINYISYIIELFLGLHHSGNVWRQDV